MAIDPNVHGAADDALEDITAALNRIDPVNPGTATLLAARALCLELRALGALIEHVSREDVV